MYQRQGTYQRTQGLWLRWYNTKGWIITPERAS